MAIEEELQNASQEKGYTRAMQRHHERLGEQRYLAANPEARQERPKRASKAGAKAGTAALTVAAPEAGAARAAGAGAATRGAGAASRSPGPGGRRPAPKQRTRSQRAGVRGKQVFKSLSGKTYGGVLLAEYFAGVFLIAFSLFTKGPSKGYQEVMPDVILRLSALTGVFFVLFLLGGSQKAGKAAMWFGLLVDVAIAVNAYQDKFFDNLTSIVTGQPMQVDSTTLTASTSLTEPQATQLPDM